MANNIKAEIRDSWGENRLIDGPYDPSASAKCRNGIFVGTRKDGVKIFRHLIFVKNSLLELKRIIHPNAVLPVKVNDKSISTSGVYKNVSFIFIYFLVFLIGAVVLLFTGVDFNTAIGASVATLSKLSNVGTGIGLVGPGGSYVVFPLFTKWILMLMMILGRVELFSLITLFSRSFWRN